MSKNDKLTLKVKSIENNKKILVVKIIDKLLPGSKSNTIILEYKNRIHKKIFNEDLKFHGIIFDFTYLIYEFGDSIGSLWLRPVLKKIKCILVAKENTKIALEKLIENSVKVPILTNINDAFLMFNKKIF